MLNEEQHNIKIYFDPIEKYNNVIIRYNLSDRIFMYLLLIRAKFKFSWLTSYQCQI